MAGSYGHVVDDNGRLMSSQGVNGMLENGGDVYEAVEEMFGMIHWLADQLAYLSGSSREALVREAVQNYREGLVIGGAGGSE